MKGISKRFPGVVALNNVSLEARPGEIVALVGENGAGKSTLMKILGGIHQPDAGEIRINGEPVTIHSVNDSMRTGHRLHSSGTERAAEPGCRGQRLSRTRAALRRIPEFD